jgi:hypothetical protein
LRAKEKPTPRAKTGGRTRKGVCPERIEELVEEAIVDAHDDDERASGWACALEENLATPFETTVFGVDVTVVCTELRDGNRIVAVCARGRDRQAIDIADLPLPIPWPDGAEWIAA